MLCQLVMLKLKLQYTGQLLHRTDSLERPWCWERLKVGGEGDDRGGDGWMASPTQWAWVWVNSRSWWWTGRHGMLQSMGSQRVGHNWETELNWTCKLVDFHIFIVNYSKLHNNFLCKCQLSWTLKSVLPVPLLW